jgi:hypothetical protein
MTKKIMSIFVICVLGFNSSLYTMEKELTKKMSEGVKSESYVPDDKDTQENDNVESGDTSVDMYAVLKMVLLLRSEVKEMKQQLQIMQQMKENPKFEVEMSKETEVELQREIKQLLQQALNGGIKRELEELVNSKTSHLSFQNLKAQKLEEKVEAVYGLLHLWLEQAEKKQQRMNGRRDLEINKKKKKNSLKRDLEGLNLEGKLTEKKLSPKNKPEDK